MRSDRPGLARFAGAGALDTRPAGLNAAAHPGDGDQSSTGNPAHPLALPMRSAPPPPGGLRRPKKASSARQRQMLMPLAACMQPCSAERPAAGAIRRVQAQERDAERGRWVVSVLATRGIDLFAANAIHGGAKRRHARGRYVQRLCCQVN